MENQVDDVLMQFKTESLECGEMSGNAAEGLNIEESLVLQVKE